MARYVSRGSAYSHGIAEGEVALVHGLPVETKQKVMAQFQAGLALDHEVKEATERLTFKGLPDGVTPATRIGVFDTAMAQKAYGWSDEFRADVEAVLDNSPANGKDFIRVEELRTPKPWAKYDEQSVEEILSLVDATGVDADLVRRYEQENENRDEIISAMVERGAENATKGEDLDRITLPTETVVVRA